jgi:histidinol dehydrogenase
VSAIADAVAAIIAAVRAGGDTAVREHALRFDGWVPEPLRGLWVGKFLKTVTHQEIADPASSARIGEICARQCRIEGFEAHARTADLRVSRAAALAGTWPVRDT